MFLVMFTDVRVLSSAYCNINRWARELPGSLGDDVGVLKKEIEMDINHITIQL